MITGFLILFKSVFANEMLGDVVKQSGFWTLSSNAVAQSLQFILLMRLTYWIVLCFITVYCVCSVVCQICYGYAKHAFCVIVCSNIALKIKGCLCIRT